MKSGEPSTASDAAPAVTAPAESYGKLFLRFLRFGSLAWGGPVAQIDMIRHELVTQEKWISPAHFKRLLAIYQVLPGPEAHELCVHFGMLARGRVGGLLAGLGFMLPGFVLMFLLSWIYLTFDLKATAFQAVFLGIQPAVIALIVRACHRIGGHCLTDGPLWVIGLLAAFAELLGVSFYISLPLAGIAYVVAAQRRWFWAATLGLTFAAAVWQLSPVIAGRESIFPPPAPLDATQTRATSQAGTAQLFGSGLRAGLLTFGGAYTAIPFLRNDAVERGRWMTERDFLDGVALSGILPAPLIIFSTFVGYFGGGAWGALAMTLGVFLPAFGFSLLFHRHLEAVIRVAEMCLIGLPVPAGFTITTEVCNYYYANNKTYPPELKKQVEDAMRKTEEVMGARFGDPKKPLLVSCRSRPRVSMPGMMDTVLNIGLNEKTLQGLIESTGNERFAWDSYRRFVQMYGDVVLDLKPTSKTEIDPFEHIMEELKHERKLKLDTELTVKDLQELVKRFKAAVKAKKGKDFPDDPMEQMWGAVASVFGSWNNDRAIVYRRQYGYPHEWGTAANICSMVFGNMGDDSGTGVAFTRDPATGEKVFYGEYLINAQGEDVVAGIRTPKKIAELAKDMPACYKQLDEIRGTLEKHYRDVQDIEFTVQKGKLWMLQTRNGKRTGFAGVRFAVDMVEEGLITKEEALSAGRIPPDDLNQLLQPIFDPDAKRKAKVIAKGINAGPGAATGKIKFFADDAEAYVQKHGKGVILVRRETSPEDLRGMQAADGILTAFGGASSHAALVSRQMGKVCVVGCQDLQIDYTKRTVTTKSGVTLKEDDFISVDGFTGEVMQGQVATKPSEVVQVLIAKTLKPAESRVYQQFAKLMEWADAARTLKIRTNADQPDQAEQAIAFGAEGIGLCRTEHMFFDHIMDMRQMILSETTEERKTALAELLNYQRADFEGIFKAMKGHPVTIRTLDPPLHEFLPHDEKGQAAVAKELGVTKEKVAERVKALHEFNPMLGFRGCRLGIVYPEITEMQARAIFEAACNVKKAGTDVHPEVMIPLVGFLPELKAQAKIVHDTAQKVFAEKGIKVDYQVGTMIELPRACVVADQIAKEAQFFSFGTNDLTQTGLGMSRDDYGSFIRHYLESDVVPKDPFQTIDFEGIGNLMQLGVERGRKTRADLKIGICGEHGGDPDSVKFCHKIGLNYVSCSPFRVPIARLAAAQAALAK